MEFAQVLHRAQESASASDETMIGILRSGKSKSRSGILKFPFYLTPFP